MLRLSRQKTSFDDAVLAKNGSLHDQISWLSPSKRRSRTRRRLYLTAIAVLGILWILFPRLRVYHYRHERHSAMRKQIERTRSFKSDLASKYALADYGELLMDFYQKYPNTNATDLAFSQMAFQTKLYASMLQDDRLSVEQKRRYELKLWSFFVPGITQIRQAALTKVEDKTNRGIILSTNDGRLNFACQFLAILREVYHSTLPVEVYHYGEKEMPPHLRDHLITTYGVRIVDLGQSRLFDKDITSLETAGWAIKAYALLATNFQEIIMADDDTVFLTHPNVFFDQKAYIDTGTLFFRDRYLPLWTSERAHEFIVKQLSNREPTQMLSDSRFWKEQLWHQQESGVVVVNKSKPEVLAALLFIAWENSAPIREKITYDYFYGDKESYWLAFELAGFPYHMVNHHAGLIGDEHADFADGFFCTDKPLHFFDAEGTSSKGNSYLIPHPSQTNKSMGLPAWFNGSLRANKHHYLNEDTMMDVSTSIWAVDGDWDWNKNGSCLCLHNYTRGRMSDYGLDLTVGRLAQVGTVATHLLEDVRKSY